ncbi:hypothetical protein [Herbiconiux liukaitaii]|uniref:hypothetical protein n=1 Tax=Herbiconiux liukaitaii TaxID=3342799 RepID=UPI0035BB89D2
MRRAESMRRASATSPTGVAALLGIPGAGSYTLLGIYLVTIAVLAATAGGAPMRGWTGWVSLALTVAAAFTVVSRGPSPLPLAKTIAIIGATTASSILLPLELDPRVGAGYTTWHILAGTLILLALAVRGRIGGAWAGFGLMAAATVGWKLQGGGGPIPGLLMVSHEAVALLAGTLFAVGLARITRSLALLHQLETSRAAEVAAAHAAAAEHAVQMRRFSGSVAEALAAIASGAPPTPEAQASYRALEGDLRDRIRGQRLHVEPLISSVRSARLRGVEMALLDDTGASDSEAPDAHDASLAELGDLARRIASDVDRVHEGAVTIRLTSTTTHPVASVVVVSANGTTRLQHVTTAS